MSMRFVHTMVRVRDVDESLNFYCNLLGLEEIRRYDSEAGRFTLIFLAAPKDSQCRGNAGTRTGTNIQLGCRRIPLA